MVLKPLLKPSRKVLITIENQLKQVVSKVPNLSGRSLTVRPRNADDGSKPLSPSGVPAVHLIPRHSLQGTIAPRGGTIVEVIDEMEGGGDDVLKRDEIKRPSDSRVRGSDFKATNDTWRRTETLTEERVTIPVESTMTSVTTDIAKTTRSMIITTITTATTTTSTATTISTTTGTRTMQ